MVPWKFSSILQDSEPNYNHDHYTLKNCVQHSPQRSNSAKSERSSKIRRVEVIWLFVLLFLVQSPLPLSSFTIIPSTSLSTTTTKSANVPQSKGACQKDSLQCRGTIVPSPFTRQDDDTCTTQTIPAASTVTRSSRKFLSFSLFDGSRYGSVSSSSLKAWMRSGGGDRDNDDITSNDGEDRKEEDGDDEDDSERAVRNRIRNWLRPSSSKTTSNTDENDERRSSSPVKTKLEGLFTGMPSISEMFRDDDKDDGGDESQNNPSTTEEDDYSTFQRKTRLQNRKNQRLRSNYGDDFSWFEEERRAILKSYEKIETDMLETLDNQRKLDPESVPENAEAMMKSILKQEMDLEIKETRDKMALDRLLSYEQQQRAQVDKSDGEDSISTIADARVRRLIDEGEAEYERQMTAKLQFDEFRKYEEEAFRKAATSATSTGDGGGNTEGQKADGVSTIKRPDSGSDLDQWALERLEAMASRQQELSDRDDVDELNHSEAVLDILEENLEDLRKRMEKESTKASRQPETMKEWQIYRAIATRLGATVEQDGRIVMKNKATTDDDDDDSTKQQQTNTDDGNVTDEDIFRRLQSWKEYNEKEASIRELGGLARGPKLPFEWQELESSGDSDRTQQGKQQQRKSLTRAEKERRVAARKQINRMSIEALESLLEKSDAARREKLKKEIDFLKKELESKDYLDDSLDNEYENSDDENSKPVDLSGVFSSTAFPDDKRRPTSSPPTKASDGNQEYASSPSNPDNQKWSQSSRDNLEDSTTPVPRPNTAFFTEGEEGVMDVAQTDSKLGSMEDQKLEAMYRRAGARTRAEQEKIKAGWEDFKRIEEEKRKFSGLGIGDDSSDNKDLADQILKYNVSEVMKDGGDFDAEKILSAIGPRPKRTRKDQGGNSPSPDESTVDDKVVDPSLQSNIDQKDVMSSLYRSVSAAGGGRFKDDPEAKARDEAKFSEYLQMEKQMREQMDSANLTNDSSEEKQQQSFNPESLDDEKYAEKIIAGLGPRPTPKKQEKVDERYLSDTGAAIRDNFDEDDDDDIASDDDTGSEKDIQTASQENAVDDHEVPDWVKREKEAKLSPKRSFMRGEEIEEAFGDDEYEKNMRQLAEYERRRAGKSRQMGIDVSDIFAPRRDIDSDDYKDYKYDDEIIRGQRFGWGGATFETRKRDLMEYNELDVPILNALMEQKNAISVTGVSPYMAKINKPFREFGAIFRLEGVIVDISGLQMEAWAKTAESFGVRKPSIEEVKMASVNRPELAVKEIFGWSTDLSEIQSLASSFRDTFNEEFNAWSEQNGLNKPLDSPTTPSSSSNRGSLAIGEEVVAEQVLESTAPVATRLDEREILGLLTQAWTKTADKFNLPWPVNDAIVASASMEPELAAIEVFHWTNDPRRADEIASFQRLAMKTLREGKALSNLDDDPTQPRRQPAAKEPTNMDKNSLMELHYRAWIAVASSFGFDRPTSDEVLGAFVLNDPVIVVKSGFGWTNDSDKALEIGQAFTEKLRGLLDNPTESFYGGVAQSAPTTVKKETDVADTNQPSFEDVLKIHETGWKVSCSIHGYPAPSPEQLRLSVSMDPSDFIQKVMRWTDDDTSIARIASTFQDTVDEAAKAAQISGVLRTQDDTKKKKEPSNSNMGPSFDEIFNATLAAWKAVADKYGLSFPTTDQIMYAMSVGPDEAIRYGFRWATKEERVSELLACYMKEIERQRAKWSTNTTEINSVEAQEDEYPLVQVNPGTEKWIQSLLDVEMECGIVSHLSRPQVEVLMEYAGISKLIGPDKRVYGVAKSHLRAVETTHYYDAQQMLAASLRVERRPDHCVVIDASPGASVAARSVEMQSVAWIGSYPRYELLSADSTVSRLDELTALNIRRLFGERVYDQPLLDSQKTDLEKNKKVKTSFSWDDE